MNKYLLVTAGVAALLSHQTCFAAADSGQVDARLQNLQQQLLKVQEQIDELKKEQAAIQAKQVVAQSNQPTVTPTTQVSNEPAVMTKNANVTLEGRVHFDYNWFDGAYNVPALGDSGSDLFARRIRTGIDTELGDWEHSLVLEFADNTAEIIIARVRYNGLPNGIKVQFGKLREDISLNALTSSNDTGLMERSSLADTFSPYFRWGASAYQFNKSTGLRWALGVHKNDAFGASGKDESGSVSLAYNGRLTWAYSDEDSTLHIGGWHSHREMGGDQLSAKLARGEVRRTATRLVDYAAGGQLVRLDSLSQTGFEFAWQYQSLTVEAELAQRTLDAFDRLHVLDGSHQQGYHISLSYFLQGHQRKYSTGSAVFTAPKLINNAWEVMGRMSRLDASDHGQGTDVMSYTLGLSYYFNPNIKLMGNVIFSDVSGAGQFSLSGPEDSGTGYAARLHYVF